MKSRDTERLLKTHVLPDLPGWAVKGTTLFMRPIGIVFRAVTLQASAYGGGSFYVSASARPMYLPPESFGGVLFGDRIGAEEVRTGAETVFAKRLRRLIDGPATHLIDDYAEPERIVKNADLRAGDPYRLEAVGYSLAWIGKYDAALPPLERAIEGLREYVQRPIHGDWGEAVLERIGRFRVLLMTDPAQAKAQLERWAQQTAEKQKLTRYL